MRLMSFHVLHLTHFTRLKVMSALVSTSKKPETARR